MNYILVSNYKTPYGELMLGAYEGCLCLSDWRYRRRRLAIDSRLKSQSKSEYLYKQELGPKQKTNKTIKKNIKILKSAKKQLVEYFAGDRKIFSIPLIFLGTDFQKKVWQSLADIPFGETTTYKNLSEKLGNIKAVRAVANTNGANALALFIPCHRVVGSDGSLTGYAGGLDAKRRLLDFEDSSNSQSLSL